MPMSHQEEENNRLRIDVDAVLQRRASRYYKYIPGKVIRWLERTIRQDDLNYLLLHNGDSEGVDFCRGVIRDLGITYDVHGNFPAAADTRPVIVSNHPLGALDGLILSMVVADAYGRKDIKFVVNDLLHAVVPLRPIFLPVNKHGAQSREASRAIDEAFAGDAPIIMFPAGMVSRRGADGRIADLKWHKMAVQKTISSGRNIIPVYFSGHNSSFFYKFARLRTVLGLKFNIEMIYLPREIFNSREAHYDIYVGPTIENGRLRGGRDAQSQADELRAAVYALADREK